MTEQLSNCCQANVKIPRYKLAVNDKNPLEDKKEYVCCKCHLGCDVISKDQPKDWEERFDEEFVNLLQLSITKDGQSLEDKKRDVINFIYNLLAEKDKEISKLEQELDHLKAGLIK